MRLDDALEQLSAIHVQVLRSETFRGYKAVPTALTGVLAIVAAAVQAAAVPAADARGFACYWIAVAAIAGLLCAGELAFRTLRDGDPHARQRAGVALRQLVPAIGVGAALTFALLDTEAAPMLPALWSMCFGLGLSASRPFLPAAIGGVATFYLLAGALLLLPPLRAPVDGPLAMGAVFGLGQLWAAWILHRAEVVCDGR
jgi:hypothetical protein